MGINERQAYLKAIRTHYKEKTKKTGHPRLFIFIEMSVPTFLHKEKTNREA